MPHIILNVNGKERTLEVAANALLVDVLRSELKLTGTHVGCDTSQCGACVVHIDGRSVKSCTTLAVQAHDCQVVTIEGMSDGNSMHPVQAAFKEAHGLQCGFCTPGMVMSTIDLLSRNANPTEDEIRSWLKGNICRCTGYHNIVKAVQIAAKSIATKVAAE